MADKKRNVVMSSKADGLEWIEHPAMRGEVICVEVGKVSAVAGPDGEREAAEKALREAKAKPAKSDAKSESKPAADVKVSEPVADTKTK